MLLYRITSNVFPVQHFLVLSFFKAKAFFYSEEFCWSSKCYDHCKKVVTRATVGFSDVGKIASCSFSWSRLRLNLTRSTNAPITEAATRRDRCLWLMSSKITAIWFVTGLQPEKKSGMRSTEIAPDGSSAQRFVSFLRIFPFLIFRRVWILSLSQEKKRRKQNQLIFIKPWNIRFRTFCLNKNKLPCSGNRFNRFVILWGGCMFAEQSEFEEKQENSDCRQSDRQSKSRHYAWWNPLYWIAVGIIRFYRKFISPMKAPCCRFLPTCSEYALEAFRRHGFFKGLFLSVRRIFRCNPFGKGGFDPVPSDFHIFKKRK